MSPGLRSQSGSGKTPSHISNGRAAGSAARRLNKADVPDRGRPVMIIGAVIGRSRISGWRRNASCTRNLVDSSCTSRSRCCLRPWSVNGLWSTMPISARSPSRKSGEPKSSRPVAWRASSIKASSSSLIAAPSRWSPGHPLRRPTQGRIGRGDFANSMHRVDRSRHAPAEPPHSDCHSDEHSDRPSDGTVGRCSGRDGGQVVGSVDRIPSPSHLRIGIHAWAGIRVGAPVGSPIDRLRIPTRSQPRSPHP